MVPGCCAIWPSRNRNSRYGNDLGAWRPMGGRNKKDGSTIKVGQWAGFGFFAMSIDYRLKGTTSGSRFCYQDLQSCAFGLSMLNAQKYNVNPQADFPDRSIRRRPDGLAGRDTGRWTLAGERAVGKKRATTIRAAISVAAAYDLVSLDWGA